jgi:hypothetical protein
MLNLDGNARPYQSIEKLGPSQKCPKWLTKTLESVCSDEIGKIGTRSSTRQDNGDGVDNSDSCDFNDIDVSYDCKLNLATNLEPSSFEEFVFHDEWKEDM